MAWLIMQIADIVLGNIAAPAWVMQALMFFLAIGFPIAIFFAWAFEMTPEGIKREHEVHREESITHETGRKLNRTIMVVLIAAVAFLLIDKFILREPPTTQVAATDKSVAVLPFVPMSSGPDDEFFADGLTEEILNSLTRVPELLVTARTSAFHFKGKDIPIPEIATTLGVAHVVEGSVRRSGDQMRVTAQLIRANDGFHLWSETYDHDTNDAFRVQKDIAEKIATALDIVLDEDQLEQMHAAGIRDPEAFVTFQKGFDMFIQAHEDFSAVENLAEANRWLDRSVALHAENPVAYWLRADLYAHTLLNASAGIPITTEEIEAAFAGFTENQDDIVRFALDDGTRFSARFDKKLISGDWRGLTALFDELVRIRTCNVPSWTEMATVTYGMEQKFLELAKPLIDCDPLNFGGWRNIVHGYNWLGDHEAAIDAGLRGVEITSHAALRYEFVKTHLLAGDFGSAEAITNRDVQDPKIALDLRVRIAAARGNADEARSLIGEIVAGKVASGQQQASLISLFSIAGMRDEANRRAAEADARPFGHLTLMLLPLDCQCGAPFDLEFTPNFAKLLERAELPWPPKKLMDWPLMEQ